MNPSSSSRPLSSSSYGLDPSVVIPTSLSSSILDNLPLELVTEASPALQSTALTMFSHKVQSLAGAFDKGHYEGFGTTDIRTDEARQKDLFCRAVSQAKLRLAAAESSKEKQKSQTNSSSSSPSASPAAATTTASSSPSHGPISTSSSGLSAMSTTTGATTTSAMPSTATAVGTPTRSRPIALSTTPGSSSSSTPPSRRALSSTAATFQPQQQQAFSSSSSAVVLLPDYITPQMLQRLRATMQDDLSPSQQDAVWHEYARRLQRAASSTPEYVPGTHWRIAEIQNNPPRQEQIFRQTVQDQQQRAAAAAAQQQEQEQQQPEKQQERVQPKEPPSAAISSSNSNIATKSVASNGDGASSITKTTTSPSATATSESSSLTPSSKSGRDIKRAKSTDSANSKSSSTPRRGATVADNKTGTTSSSSSTGASGGKKVDESSPASTTSSTSPTSSASSSSMGRGSNKEAEQESPVAANVSTPSRASSSAGKKQQQKQQATTPSTPSTSTGKKQQQQQPKLKLAVDSVEFEVYGETAQAYLELSESKKQEALQFCKQAIFKRREFSSSTIRNPSGYHAKTLENYVIHGVRAPIPPSEMTAELAKSSSAVPPSQQPQPQSSSSRGSSNKKKKNGSVSSTTTVESPPRPSSLAAAAATAPKQQQQKQQSSSSSPSTTSDKDTAFVAAGSLPFRQIHTRVSVHTSLTPEILNRVPLERIQHMSASQQESVLLEFANQLAKDRANNNISNKHGNVRYGDVFRRALEESGVVDNKKKGNINNQKQQQEQQKSQSNPKAAASASSQPSSSITKVAALTEAVAASSSSSTGGTEKQQTIEISKTVTKNGRVVRLELEGESATLFESLRPEHQKQARKYCEEAAKRILNSGQIIQKPAAFHGSTLRTYIKKNILASGEEPMEFVLSGSALSLYESLLPDQKVTARQHCMEAATLVLLKGQAIRNPADYFGNTMMNYVRKYVLSSGSNSDKDQAVPTFELEGPAARKFELLRFDHQVAAQKFSEDAAAQVFAETGKPIRKPVGFYSKKVFEYCKMLHKQGKRQQYEQLAIMTGAGQKEKGETDGSGGDDSSSRNQSKEASASSSSTQPHHHRGNAGPVTNGSAGHTNGRSADKYVSDTKSAAAASSDEASKLRRELLETRAQLEKKTRDCHDLTKRCSDLSNMWENEKAIAEAARDSFRKLEASVEDIQNKEDSRKDELAAIISEKQGVEEKHEESQKMLRDMTATFTRISQELCHEREAKRDLEKLLEKERVIIQTKDMEIQKLKAEVKRMDMLRPSLKKTDNGGKQLASLRRELQETQEKLAKEKRKNSALTSRNSGSDRPSSSIPREKPSLADFVLDATGTDSSRIQILKPPSEPPSISATSNDAASETTPSATETPYALQHLQMQSEKDTSIRFVGVGEKYDAEGNELDERVKEELDFLALSYGSDELTVEPHQVTRSLRLHIDRNDEVVLVDLLVSIPEGYPVDAPLTVEASLSVEGASYSIEARKVALDALPGLVDVCRCEANGSLGNEALLQVLSVADQWVQNDWVGIQTKRLPATQEGAAGSATAGLEICRMLVFSHHIVDAGKIQFVLKTASKYGLGGYVKTGKPGYVLVEGLEDNCDFFLETVVQQRGKLRESRQTKTDSATFQQVGKETAKVDDLDEGRVLPRKVTEMEHSKEAMAILSRECSKVGLQEYLAT